MRLSARTRPRSVLKRLGERHATPIGVALVAVVAFLSWIAATSVNTAPFSSPLSLHAVVPADAPILRAGDEVRIGGVRVGDIRSVQPVSGGRLVTFDLTHGKAGRNATITVRQRGFSGSVYLQLAVGDTSHPLAAGATIPRSRTTATTDLASIAAAFGGDVRSALTNALVGYGGGLANRADDINTMLADLPALTADVQPVARGLTPTPGALAGLLHELNRTAAGFSPPGNTDLGRLVSAAHVTVAVTAQQRRSLQQLIDNLRPFEDQALTTLPVADPLLTAATAMSRRLTPAVAQLNAALPDLNSLLAEKGNLPQLTALSHGADPVLLRATPLLPELTPVGQSLAPFFNPLRPFANYLEPYRADLIQDMQLFNQWTQFRYAEGIASGARAVRFGPVFTCAHPQNAYPQPGQSKTLRAASLAQACQ